VDAGHLGLEYEADVRPKGRLRAPVRRFAPLQINGDGGSASKNHKGQSDGPLVPVKPGPPDDPNGPDSSCWINWIMAFKYSPEYQRAAKWDVGQEEHFMLSSLDLDDPNCDGVYDCAADSAMMVSFKFIQRDGRGSCQN